MNPEQGDKEIQKLLEEIKLLRRAVEELSMLNEIAVAISSTLSLERILDLIIQKCLKHLNVEQGAIMLLDEKTEDKPFQTVARRGDTISLHLPYRLDSQLSGWMLKNRNALIINDFQSDNRFLKRGKEPFFIQSLLCVPLKQKGRMIGLIALFNSQSNHGFSSEASRLLSIIATQSAQVIENARLLEEEQALIRMQEELRLAYEIQMNLLPTQDPVVDGYDIAGKSIPAKDVGGDYFDFIPMNNHQLAFCLGDVSGKGIPAALLMANLQAAIRSQTLLNVSSSACLEHSNLHMFQNSGPEKFATLFYGILDVKSHQLRYSNAGHNYPILFTSEKSPFCLESDGIVLGCLESFCFHEEQISLSPGDLFILYSDGITEAFNSREEEFGEEKLIEVIEEIRGDSAQNILEKILHAVRLHTGDSPQADDITLVVIKRNI
ncbi:MAG: SpoIIE family protein phosphatase [Candidatus Aminicenantes bacterium]|nr:SpoIIE family protein phosphatase [Candidatus Aminicenantes bacterium]